MSAYDWFQTAQAIIMLVATVILYVVWRSFQGGAWAANLNNRLTTLETGQTALKQSVDQAARDVQARFDRTGQRLSDTMDEIQVEFDRIRQEHARADILELHVQEFRTAHQRAQSDITAIWQELRHRASGNRRE